MYETEAKSADISKLAAVLIFNKYRNMIYYIPENNAQTGSLALPPTVKSRREPI